MTITEGSMPFGDSLLLSLVGMGFVFAILALLAVIVVIMARVVGHKPKKSEAAVPAAAAVAAVSAAPEEETAFGGSMKLIGVEDREAVLIMAIVAENSGVPLNELVFKSIRAID